MSSKTFCDRCGLELDYNNRVRIEFVENGKRVYKDFHIDCFNYEFYCNIRKIKGDEQV